MGQEPEATPAEGEKPEAAETKEGQEPTPAGKTFDEAYVKELRAENAATRKKAQEAAARLEELEERDKSELEKLTGKLAKLEQAKAEAEGKLLRFEVAKEKEIPAEAVDLLSGTTREDLEASADKILNLVKSRTENKDEPDFDGGPREPSPDPKTPEQEHNETILALAGLKPN